MPRPTRTPKASPAVRVTSSGCVRIENHSLPVIPEAAIETTVRIGRLTFRADYEEFASSTPSPYLNVTLDRGTGAKPVDLIVDEMSHGMTVPELRAFARALDAIATEIERELPPLHAEAARVAGELRCLGLEIP